MEKKIGDIFEYLGRKLKVVKSARDLCFGCYFFDDKHCQRIEREGGECSKSKRTDHNSVIFMEVKDEQPQEQTGQPQEQAEQQTEQPQGLNLCEILKYCPQGETFWSPMLGDVKLYDINQEAKMVDVELESGDTWDINADGTITFGNVTSQEIMLYPSREQRDWTKVKYEKKKKRFDPNTLQPFDRVLVRDNKNLVWKINIYSHKCYNLNHPYQCITSVYRYCIPYNDDTKHLVGKTDEAPDFYKYWEK